MSSLGILVDDVSSFSKHLQRLLLLIQSHNIGSPISVLYYDYYDDIQEVNNFVKTYDTKVQCVVSDILSVKNPVCFGNSQAPELCDFPDNIDVMNFIISN